MDPHLLRTFVTVARCASFSAAARELGYTQSAVSQQIAALESDLRTPLLGRRPVAPTPAGERLLEHARPLLLRLDAARADLLRLTASPPERLTVTASPLALGAGAVAALPNTGVTLRVVDRETVPLAVASGDGDLGLVDGVAAPSDPLRLPDLAPLTVTGVAEEPLAVLLPAGHPLARCPALDLADLADARWLDAPGTALPLEGLRSTLSGARFRQSLRYDGTDVSTLCRLAAAGHGLALLPRSVAGAAGVGVAVPLASPALVHRTEVLVPKVPTAAAAVAAGRLLAHAGPVPTARGQ
ncbi:LysR family transcriptional regulator [Streptomyces sp. NPDC006879]|uniref:LysR family transcriptional regulator n=1 Tax=Streptomyces sp. NPDC006879 TaxID=3364767 RepID=UPI0036C910DE